MSADTPSSVDDRLAELDFENQPDEPAAAPAAELAVQEPPAEGEAPPAEPETPWWAQYGETEEEAARQIDNINRLRGHQANELGEARKALERLQGAQPQAAQAQGQEDELIGGYTVEELREMAEEDPFAASLIVTNWQMEQQVSALEERFERREQNNRAAQGYMEHLKGVVGHDVIDRNRMEIGRVVQALAASQSHEYFADPATGGIDLELIKTVAEVIDKRSGRNGAGRQAQPARDAQGRFVQPPPGEATRTAHVEGGSGPQPSAATPAEIDPLVAEIDQQAMQKTDAFGRRYGQ